VSDQDNLEIESEDLEGDLTEGAFAPRRPARLARFFTAPALPAWARLVGWGIVVILAIMLVAANWAPVRLDFVLWKWDVPKAIVFVFFAALGAALVWARLRPRSRPAKPEAAEEE
jgi:uncharacterized integral membrane protein